MLSTGVLFFVSASYLSGSAVAAGEAPVSEAGLGLIAYVGDSVILDGSGSTDPEGDALTYTWLQVGGPPVELTRADTPQPRFDIAQAGTLRFTLVVNDGLTDGAADGVEVVVPYGTIQGVESGCAVGGTHLHIAALALGFGLVVRRRR